MKDFCKWGDRTHVSGKMLLSAAAMVLTDLRPGVIRSKDGLELSRLWLADDGRLDSSAW